MARKSRRERQREEVSKEAEVDMTPMIDVVFLLIIFFLCIDFRILEAKLPAYLPKEAGSDDRDAEPQERLRVKIVCSRRGTEEPRPRSKNSYRLVDHEVHYTVGSKRVDSLEELRSALAEVYLDPNRRVDDPKHPGHKKMMSVVVEPGTDAVYGDVAPCVDTISDVGFEDIYFGGGLGSRRTGAYSGLRTGRKR